MKPKEFIQELRGLARKQGNRRGDTWISELSFWGVAKNNMDEIIRELKEQEKRID